jgi:predicted NBD/HSP70 family sugar kinase
MKLTEDHITLALTNLDADIVYRETVSCERIDPEHIAQRIAGGIRKLLQHSHVPQKRLMGIGIGLAGIVDAERGIVRSSPIWGWKNVPFAAVVEKLTGFATFIDNDVNTLTQVERLYGRGVGVDHFLTVTVGRGVGLGIVANGQLYRGLGGAGELGHTIIEPTGYTCDCGKMGCLETFVGDPWLVRRANTQALMVQNAEELARSAESGNIIAIDILRQAGEMLGKAIAVLVNVLHPQLIIFSGEGIRYGDFLLQPAYQSLTAHVMSALTEGLVIHIEPLGDDAWARGAASIVLQELFRTAQPELERVGSA